MSRTYRNRRSVPHGWVVRDGGEAFSAEYPNRRALRQAWRAWVRCEGWTRWRPMPPKFRRSYLSKETSDTRRELERRYRAVTRNHMRHGRWEAIAAPVGTCGWCSW